MNRPAITPTFLLVLVVVLCLLGALAVAELAQRRDELRRPGPPTGLRIVPTPRAAP